MAHSMVAVRALGRSDVNATTGTEAAATRRREHRLWTVGWGVRLGAAALLVAACALAAPQDLAVIGFGAAFGWAPLVGVAEALRRRRGPQVGAIAAAGLDLVGLGLAIGVSPELAPYATWLPFLLVALYSQADLRLGAVVAAASVGIAAVAQVQVPLPGPELVTVGLYATALAGTVWLQRGWRASQVETSRALSLAHGRAEAALAHIADAVVVTASGGRVQRLNPAAERTLGCDADVAIGARCHEVFELRHDGRPLDCSTGCALLAVDGATATGTEVSRTLQTGAVQPLLATARLLRDPHGQAVEVVHSFQDISELKRVQEAQQLFLATATHELKTPLTLILGFAEMLRSRSDLSHAQREVALDTIHRRAEELDRIVEQLLLTSRIGSGRLDLRLTTGDVRETVRGSVAAIDAVTERSVRFEAPTHLPPALHDPEALTTVVDHLVDNALKYSPDGGTVEVTVHAQDTTVDLEVRDHGIGMTPEQQRRCFERFWQAEGDNVRRFAGTGLGLHIVRSLVTAMDGDLSLVSAPGQGTTFRVHLARADRTVEGSEPTTLPQVGERSMVDEFMRQAGLKENSS